MGVLQGGLTNSNRLVRVMPRISHASALVPLTLSQRLLIKTDPSFRCLQSPINRGERGEGGRVLMGTYCSFRR